MLTLGPCGDGVVVFLLLLEWTAGLIGNQGKSDRYLCLVDGGMYYFLALVDSGLSLAVS